MTIDGAPELPITGGGLSGDIALEHIVRVLRGEQLQPDWTDMTRAFEIVDAARRSIRRRRTIDLHFETTSERGQFKTQMTAIGCGLLVATILAVLVLLMLGAIFEINKPALRVARIAVFAPLFVYLILQGLLFLSRPSIAPRAGQKRNEQEETPSGHGHGR